MKKIIYIAVAAIAVLSSCSSEEFTQSSNGNNGDAKVFTGTIESDGVGSRTTLTSEKKVNWVSGDKVNIGGKEYTAASDGATTTFTGSGATKSGDVYKAYYPSTMYNEGTITLPASYTYDASKTDVAQFNMPMYAQSETTDLGFQNICGVLAIKVTSAEMSKVTSITVTSDKAISGTCTINGDGTEGNKYYATVSDDGGKTITLTCSSAVTPKSESEGGTVFYIPVPVLTTSSTLYITVHGDANATKAANYAPFIYTQSMKATGVTIARNTLYNITFATSLAKFSVSSTKTVNFTNANVYYDGSALQFESSQIAYPTTRETSHVGHFFWTVDKAYSYIETYPTSSITPQTIDTPWFASDVTVGSTGSLRVLTGDANGEYKYLIDRGTDLCKYGVTVGSATKCLIIAPDNFVGTLKASYTDENELKAYGLVCLPAAGYWDGTNIVRPGQGGNYWSATPCPTGLLDANATQYYALRLSFGDDVNANNNYYLRSGGYSIRLVKTIQAESGQTDNLEEENYTW